MTKNIFRVPNHHGRLVSENQIEFVTEHYNFDARIMKKHEKPIIQEGKLIIQNEIKEVKYFTFFVHQLKYLK